MGINNVDTNNLNEVDKEKVKSILTNVLLKESSTKESKVVRLNQAEQKLIEFVRKVSPQILSQQLKSAFENSDNKNQLSGIKLLSSILENREPYNIDDLLSFGFISPEQLSDLKKALMENKNIIITGKAGIGKSTLLTVLVELLKAENKDFIYFDETELVDMNRLTDLLYDKDKRLIVDEVKNISELMAIIYSLQLKNPILTTMVTNGDLKESIKLISEGKIVSLNDTEFINVEIFMDDEINKSIKNITTIIL